MATFYAQLPGGLIDIPEELAPAIERLIEAVKFGGKGMPAYTGGTLDARVTFIEREIGRAIVELDGCAYPPSAYSERDE